MSWQVFDFASAGTTVIDGANVITGSLSANSLNVRSALISDLTAGYITTGSLSFTPVTSGSGTASDLRAQVVQAIINSTEDGGLRIAGSRIRVDGDVFFGTGYSPAAVAAGVTNGLSAGTTHIHGDCIDTGTLTARALAAASITTDKLTVGTVQRSNLITNGHFGSYNSYGNSYNGWTLSGGSFVSQDGTWAGDSSVKVPSFTATVIGGLQFITQRVTVIPGRQYTLIGALYHTGGTAGIRVWAAGGNELSTAGVSAGSNVPSFYSATTLIAAGAASSAVTSRWNLYAYRVTIPPHITEVDIQMCGWTGNGTMNLYPGFVQFYDDDVNEATSSLDMVNQLQNVGFGGDTQGNYAAMNVRALQGRTLSAAAPTTNSIMGWNGSAWGPLSPGSAIGYTPANLAGDAFTGRVTAPYINLNRSNQSGTGMKWYSSGYNAWQDYMAPASANQGADSNITPPAGTYVTSWALRSFIENAGGYGWTWESGGSGSTTPGLIAELSASTGNFRTTGAIYGTSFNGAGTGLTGTATGFTAGHATDAGTLGMLALQAGGAGTAPGANQVLRTQDNGYAFFGWLNTVSGAATGTPARVYCSEDSYLRYYDMPTFTGFVRAAASGSWGINVTGSSSSCTGNALTASGVAWGNVGSKPDRQMYYSGFTLDANTMPQNSTGFTYANNAPVTGPITRICANGYDLELVANYITGDQMQFRTYDGDHGYWNGWKNLIHSGNIGDQTVLAAGKLSGHTAGYAYADGGTSTYASGETLATITNRGAGTTGAITVNGSLTVGNSTSSYIYMTDTDETTRSIHCNSNRIGFLNSSSGWGAYCDNSGNWYANNISGTNSGDQWNIGGNAATATTAGNLSGHSNGYAYADGGTSTSVSGGSANVSTCTITGTNTILRQASLDIHASDGYGLKFWNGSDAYKVYMSYAGTAGEGGGVMQAGADYNMYFRMDGGGSGVVRRGFGFKNHSLSTSPYAQIHPYGPSTYWGGGITLRDTGNNNTYCLYMLNGVLTMVQVS